MKNAKPHQFRAPWLPSPEQRRAMARREQELWRPRPSSPKRGYDRDWAALRAQHLEAEPYCRGCRAQGRLVCADTVDHIESLRIAPERRLDPTNLQSLCRSCHQKKTRAENQRN